MNKINQIKWKTPQ